MIIKIIKILALPFLLILGTKKSSTTSPKEVKTTEKEPVKKPEPKTPEKKTAPTPKRSRMKSIFIFLFWTTCVLVMLYLAVVVGFKTFFTIDNGWEKVKNIHPNANITLTGVSKPIYITKSVTQIDLDTQYGGTYILPSGHGFRFSGANVDYCVKNANSATFCAREGEDASNLMSGGHQNMKLQFKGLKGNGKLKLTIWKN